MVTLETRKEVQTPEEPLDLKVPDRFTREDAGRAALFLRDLLRANGSLSKPVHLSSRNESGEPTMAELPQLAVQLLADLLNKLGEGHAVAVETVQADLTPGQAAEVLGVDRSYLMDLLDKGKIPYRKEGNRPQISLMDILNFKRRDDDYRAELVNRLARETQNIGIDYPDFEAHGL